MSREVFATSPAIRFDRVLLCVDSSVASTRAATYICELGLPGTHIRVVSVLEDPRALLSAYATTGFNVSAFSDALRSATSTALSQARSIFETGGFVVETELIDLAVYGNDVCHALASESEAWDADLLVLGSRQHAGILRWVEGTVSGPVRKLVKCPVLVVPESYAPVHQHGVAKMLFAVDGSHSSQQALHTGIALAANGAQLKALYVVDQTINELDIILNDLGDTPLVDQGKKALDMAAEIFSGLDTSFSTECEFLNTEQAHDDIARAIVREASRWEANLLVMGTHGRHGFSGWVLGSVPDRVAHVTHTPLLLVRAASDHPEIHVVHANATVEVKSVWSRY
jgi:nucleotide-binding universal stress UspA family protein